MQLATSRLSNNINNPNRSTMLLLRQGEGESIVITGPCIITITEISASSVRVGITGDKDKAQAYRFGQLSPEQIDSIAGLLDGSPSDELPTVVSAVHRAMT